MRRDHELTAPGRRVPGHRQQGELALRRERRLRLVEEVQPTVPQPCLEQVEGGLAVGAGVEPVPEDAGEGGPLPFGQPRRPPPVAAARRSLRLGPLGHRVEVVQ